MSSITLTNVTKYYGDVQVIQTFSEVFSDKEFITLLGPSGCGKTTMLRMIAGFEKPTSGEIRIDDKVVSGEGVFVPPNLRSIGMVFQSYAVWPHMNVFDNVAYPLRIQKVAKSEIQTRVENILEAVHLSPYVSRMPNELSGGQQQRVALGRALVSNPSLLLLDEPLSNLDAKLRESMRYEIKDIQKKFGITVVYVTHDQTEAIEMSDRVIVFNKGIVQQIDTPINIYRHPANEFVEDFIGKISFVRGHADGDCIVLDDGQKINYNGRKKGAVIAAVRPESVSVF
ncbi:MAG: ABC transporter ATP-binding protein [Synergistaceae bacterium]|nr:ABC transporter ATP-binding protein [Synergistaceae bacterium]